MIQPVLAGLEGMSPGGDAHSSWVEFHANPGYEVSVTIDTKEHSHGKHQSSVHKVQAQLLCK